MKWRNKQLAYISQVVIKNICIGFRGDCLQHKSEEFKILRLSFAID